MTNTAADTEIIYPTSLIVAHAAHSIAGAMLTEARERFATAQKAARWDDVQARACPGGRSNRSPEARAMLATLTIFECHWERAFGLDDLLDVHVDAEQTLVAEMRSFIASDALRRAAGDVREYREVLDALRRRHLGTMTAARILVDLAGRMLDG